MSKTKIRKTVHVCVGFHVGVVLLFVHRWSMMHPTFLGVFCTCIPKLTFLHPKQAQRVSCPKTFRFAALNITLAPDQQTCLLQYSLLLYRCHASDRWTFFANSRLRVKLATRQKIRTIFLGQRQKVETSLKNAFQTSKIVQKCFKVPQKA